MIFDDYDDSEWAAKAHSKISAKRIGSIVPSASFKIRVRDESIEGPNPFRWDEMSTFDIFAGKRVIVFSLPGAFTPTCSTYQDRKSTRLNSSHMSESRMPSSA